MDDKNLKNKKHEEQTEEVELSSISGEEVEETSDASLDVDIKDQRINELEDQLKRAVADYRNLERRNIEERMDAIKFANKHLIEALLPAFDTLFLAAKYTTDESVRLTIGRIVEVLKENGIEKVDTKNVKYNADHMEAIEVVPGEKEMIVEEVRPGFLIHGKLIRPAQVRVGKGE